VYRKWGAVLDVTVLLMEVTQTDDQWLEADVRQRRWVTPEQAQQLLTRPKLRSVLNAAIQHIEDQAEEM
jgi:hypothetical protein